MGEIGGGKISSGGILKDDLKRMIFSQKWRKVLVSNFTEVEGRSYLQLNVELKATHDH